MSLAGWILEQCQCREVVCLPLAISLCSATHHTATSSFIPPPCRARVVGQDPPEPRARGDQKASEDPLVLPATRDTLEPGVIRATQGPLVTVVTREILGPRARLAQLDWLARRVLVVSLASTALMARQGPR